MTQYGEYIREALELAEDNAGDRCPLSSDVCGAYFEQIRDLLRKVVGNTEVAEANTELQPVSVGLGWFPGLDPEVRKAKMDAYLAKGYGLCGCGKPVRYIVPGSGEPGACNKYARCHAYDELKEKHQRLVEAATAFAVEPMDRNTYTLDHAKRKKLIDVLAIGEALKRT